MAEEITSNGIPFQTVVLPPPRNVGTPDSADTPAPVSTKTCLASRNRSCNSGEISCARAFELAVERAAASDLCFVVGTSALVFPAAGLPEIAKTSGAYVCEINPERTPLSDLCDEVITGRAGDVLPMFSK